MKNSIHPISQHSQTKIKAAFWKLMEYKNYEDITITAIAKKAQIDRRTFYRNFSSKQLLIDHTVVDLLEDYLKQYNKLVDKSFFTIIKLHFEFWQGHFEILTALNHNNMLQIILKHYEKIVPLLNIHPHNTSLSEQPYFYQYNIAGCWYLLVKWVEENGKTSPQQMAEQIINVINPALK